MGIANEASWGRAFRILLGAAIVYLGWSDADTQEIVRNLLCWRHSGFSVHGAVPCLTQPSPTGTYSDVLEGIARITDHILKPSQQMVRTWGWVAVRLGTRHADPRG